MHLNAIFELMRQVSRILLLSTAFMALFMTGANGIWNPELQIRLGGGLAGYGTKSTITIGSSPLQYVSSRENAAVTLHVPVDVRFAFNKRFNIGLEMKFGSYLYDPDSADGKSNRFDVIGIAAEWSLIARENFRWYIGAGINTCNLELQETDATTLVTSIADYRGGGLRFNSGLLFFFGKRVGMNVQLGLDQHVLDLTGFKLNSTTIDLNNVDGTLKVGGFDTALGLVFRL